ncbi:MATE family efflux transporter [Thermosediminibacter litoriperuensis]|uniref:Probable multidrug resistance protein NorM n=1 Tax=Thermosediminibacter litoriperuensis TaxID=291989 RepID=A0A5S5ABG2_9FIRM|nr:MATE family efflux transporter [Thermosediminibacter litoriperuensis]TYP46579.1 putative MATE family efflux protein [Thermosediminibacter litoriperuensis]
MEARNEHTEYMGADLPEENKKAATSLPEMDFTVGSIPAHLIKFSIPLFAGNLLQTLYNTVDAIWVGKFLGAEALAAVSVSFPIIFVLLSMVVGMTMATTVLVGQYKGAGDMLMVKKTINTSLFFLTLLAVAVSAIGIIFHRPILEMMNTPANLIDPASGYMNIFFSGLIFMFAYNTLSAILRGLGDSRTPLVFLFYSTVINIILDPLFIFGYGPLPRMGVNGVALATVISQGVSFYLAARYLNRKNHILTLRASEIKYDGDLVKRIIKIGLPAGIQQTVVALGGTAIMAVVNSFGPLVVAAWGAASKIDSFSFMPSMSLGLAASSLSAQNIGAQKYDRVKEVMKWGSLLSIAISGLVTIAVFAFPGELLALFTSDPVLVAEGAGILKILGVSYIPFGLLWVSNGILRGAGNTLVPMIISIFSLWGLRVPLAYYLANFTPLKSTGIWVAISSSMIISSALSLAYYYSGYWKKTNKNIA